MPTYEQLGTLIEGVATTATAGGTTTLVNTSERNQQFTGSSTQIMVLPDATTCKVGHMFRVMDRSTGAVTVNYNGGSLAAVVSANTQRTFRLINNSTSAGTWDITQESATGAIAVYDIIAGETLTVGDAIYICSTAADGGRTVGRAYKLDPNDQYRQNYVGIVKTGASSGGTATILTAGEASGFSGLPQGLPVYASVTTPGSWQASPPLTNSILIGWGSTVTTKLIINGASSKTSLLLAGYSLGGFLNNGSWTNSIGKMIFPSETFSTLSATLGTAVAYCSINGACSSTRGYVIGGYNGADVVNIQFLAFSSETTGAAANNLPSAARGLASFYSSSAGYAIGNGNAADTTNRKLLFSTEVVSTIGAWSYSNGYSAGMQSSSAGYVATGDGLPSGQVTNAGKMLFSTETSSSISAVAIARRWYNSWSSSTKGYIGAGYQGGGFQTSIEAVTFSSDTWATLAATFSTTNTSLASTVNSGTKAYATGESHTGVASGCTVSAFDLTAETMGTAANTIDNTRGRASGVQA